MYTKRFIPVSRYQANSGIYPLYEIESAAWIWHPDRLPGEPTFLVFRCRFEVVADPILIHVSADQRYELFLDGTRIARGPDRSDIQHWSFAAYELNLAPGTYDLDASVWWLGEHAPLALMTWRGGFILKAEGVYDKVLTTGKGPWQVMARAGVEMRRVAMGSSYHVVGDAQTIDAESWFGEEDWKQACVIKGPVEPSSTGVVNAPGWRLYPSALPDQIDRDISPGTIRAVVTSDWSEARPFTEEDCSVPDVVNWQALLDHQTPVVVPAHSSRTALWDLEDYYCAYTELTVSGGAGGRVELLWAESLYESDLLHKGNRHQVIGKRFQGFGHTVLPDGGRDRLFRSYWWSSGRYCLVTVKTCDEPLTLQRFNLNETRYPLENEGEFQCSDPDFDAVMDISTRAMQMCSHETYVDCPYYEQMMYVADARVEMLTHYIMARDDKLQRRGIELFDFSRREFGFPTERYTARKPQLSSTFAMIWVLMVRDHLLWRGDVEWTRKRMVGVRSNLEHFELYRNSDGLLESLPGWSVVDWVPGWEEGCPPGAKEDVSSIVNLHYILALRAAAEIEGCLGEVHLARRDRDKAEDLEHAIIKWFWNESRGLVADDARHEHWSEHAQCLALLAGILPPRKEQRALDGLLHASDLSRATVYFQFYLFETLCKYGLGQELLNRLEFWKGLHRQGLKTTVEKPEPSRSDCHAWGAHPLFHMHASLLGVRPAAPGFERVRIAPAPGSLRHIKAKIPHPKGHIAADLNFGPSGCSGEITLPEGVSGEFVWRGKTASLAGGKAVKVQMSQLPGSVR